MRTVVAIAEYEDVPEIAAAEHPPLQQRPRSTTTNRPHFLTRALQRTLENTVAYHVICSA